MATRNYFSFLRFGSDYITPEIAQKLQQTTIPAAVTFLQETFGKIVEQEQREAFKQLLMETTLLSNIAARSITESKDIPVVYEGYHLSTNEYSSIAELLEVLLKMIDASDMNTLCSAFYKELIATKEALVRCSKTPNEWKYITENFREKCTNIERPAA